MTPILIAAVAAPFAGIGPALGADVTEYPGYTFSDDDGNTHEGNIEAIAVVGITQGCGVGETGDQLYCPDDDITRGQFASLLDRALELGDTTEDFFDDDNGSTHEEAVNRIAAAGITSGCAADRYCPNNSLTRAQMATLLVGAFPDLVPATKDHFSDDNGNRHEKNIDVLAENGITVGCRTILHISAGPVRRYCPQDPVRRDQIASFLARALGLEPIQPTPPPWRLELVLDGITGGTTDMQALPGDDRLFLVTRDGLIRIIEDGTFLADPFLDLTADVLTEGSSERGMLGLAFHPDFGANRHFYVFYTDRLGHSQVYEYEVDASDPNRADPSTARPVITFEQRETSPTHKGGQLQFGDDGYLYVAVGDGGGSGDPLDHGENPRTELGTIIRIDVDSGDPYAIPPDNPFADGKEGLPEVWAYGLRNPWRFSFDGSHIYISDVGHVSWEEVNVADASEGGIDYGWNRMEGTHCYMKNPGCDPTGLFIPQVDYSHDVGVSVIGGYVYRGTAIPEMVGRYFYADFFGGWIRTFVYDGEVTEHYNWSRAVAPFPRHVWSFGVDGHGELYVLARSSVLKVVPANNDG